MDDGLLARGVDLGSQEAQDDHHQRESDPDRIAPPAAGLAIGIVGGFVLAVVAGLTRIGDALIDPGDIVIAANPCQWASSRQ